MESVQLLTESSDVLGGHVLSLASGDVLRADSSIIFSQDALTSGIIATDGTNDEVQAFMSVPVHVVPDSPFVGSVLIKNAAGDTFLLDPRQCNILGDTVEETQSQFIIASSTEGGDPDQTSTPGIMGLDMDFPYITNVGNVVLSDNAGVENSIDVNSSAILQLGSQMLQGANKLLPEGMCIDMSQLSIVTSNGVVSYVSTVTDENVPDVSSEIITTPQESENELPSVQEEDHVEGNILPAEEHISTAQARDSRAALSPVRFKRGRGRPRKINANQEDIMDPPVGKPPYKCDSCGFEAALWGRLKRHKESHKNEKPHRCKECGASYNVEANLTLHMATHSSDQLKCPECQRAFTRVASLRSHLMLHEREDNLFCTECGDEFALQYQLDSHVMEHQDEWAAKNLEKIFECPKCQRQFSRASALKEHMREHVKVKHSLVRRKHDRTHDRSEFSHKCPTCAKVFQKPSQLIRHTRIHTGERPYPCDICGKAFSQKGSLQIHMTKHNGDKPHECDFCNTKFSQKGNLRAHIQRVHSIPQQGIVTYHCTECPCIFKKLGSLNSHMGRAHSQVETIKTLKTGAFSSEQIIQADVNQIMAELVELEKNCEESSDSNGVGHVSKEQGQDSVTSTTQIFEDSSSVQRSKKADSSDILQEAISKSGLEGKTEADFSCKEKSSAVTGFITLADRSLDGTVRRYTIRQRRVAGVRWHQCSFCCKEFKKPSDLVRHIRVHTHEKPFKCPHCFRAFSVKSTLTAHIRTHGGQKQYSCPDCEKKFSATSSLRVHQRLHNGERPFACSVCNRTFRTSGHRQTHWLQHCDPSNTLVATPFKKRRRKMKKPEMLCTYSENLPDVLLEEPIVITEEGLMQNDAPKPPRPPAARLHNCEQCSASFRRQNQLKAHLRTHSGERPFQCQTCDRSFVSNGVLKSHLLTHEAVKAFKCNICSSAFSTQGSLKRHLIIHSSNKPFMCPYCHKTFKNKMNCKKHIKNHKTEVARAVAQQEFQGQQFVVSVGDGFSGGEIVVPHFQTFSGNDLGDPSNLREASADKLVQSGGVITHTLLADASGTITLPSSLTQENIREIEDTLNQQLSSGGSSAVLINTSQHPGIQLTSLSVDAGVQQGSGVIDFAATSDAAHAEDVAAAANLAASEAAPETNTIIEDPKSSILVTESTDISSAIFGQSFDQQAYEACTFPGITLQGDHINLSGIEQEATISANMEAILPQSRGSDRRRNCENDENHMSSSEDNIREEIEDLPLPDHCEENSVSELIEESSAPPRPSAASCEQCGRTFKRLSLLKVHMRSAHMSSPKPHVCSYCNRSFGSSNGLRLHIRSHAGEKSHVCKHCSLSFASLASLSRHMAVHTDKRPLSCSRCPESFRTQSQLRKHSKSHDTRTFKHQRSNKKVRAIILSKEQTSALANQSVDTAVSVSEKILIAAAIELSKKEIAKESKSIGLEPMFSNQCKYCPKSFKKPSDLVRHVRIHTGERPFHCDHCFRSFTVKSTLNSHRKTHLTDAPKMFPCHVCSLRFSTKGSLKVHMRLHTGSKPFKCHLCSVRFRTSGHCKAHLHSHGHKGNRSRGQKNKQILSVPEESSQNEAEATEVNTEVLTHQIITEDGTIVEVDTAALLAAGGNLDGSSLQLQIDDSLLQQFQNGGNVIIQENGTVQFVPNLVVEDGDEDVQIENDVPEMESVSSNQELPSLLPGMPTIEMYESLAEHDVSCTQQESEMSDMQLEIHTDEHGQIVNIHPALDGSGVVFADISDLNLSEGTKVSIDGSQFEILDEVPGVDDDEDGIDPSAFVTLDINDIIMAPTTASKRGKGSKVKTETGHPCSVCGKAFTKPSQLERHVRIHTGERPFPCTQCWKAFNQKNALKAHMKRHTGERPFKCLYCEHAFTQRGNLKTHIGRAHPHASDVVLPKKKKVARLPKNMLDDVSFRLDLENVVGDLFPQMRTASETD